MRVLVAGDINGNLDKLYSRVSRTMKKSGNFDCLLCVGNFFNKDTKTGVTTTEALQYLQEQSKQVPIPTFFIVATASEFDVPEDGGDICPNVTFLGKSGIKNIHGLNVAYVSGCHDPYAQRAGASTITAYTSHSLNSVLRSASSAEFGGKIDILLSSEWPNHLFTTCDEAVSYSHGSTQLTAFVRELCPRYHFAATENMFLARRPYKNVNDVPYVTRFVALAQYSDSTDPQKKWLYAVNIEPLATMKWTEFRHVPDDTTENPYTQENVKAQIDKIEAEKKRKRDEIKQQQEAKKKRVSDECWFCLDNVTEDSRHLIISHGKFTYLTLPKGGLVDNHMLIVPMQHYTGSDNIHAEIQQELQQYITSINEYFESLQSYMVAYERNIKIGGHTKGHMHIQIVPIPRTTHPTAVKQEFLQQGAEHNVSFEVFVPGDSMGEEYFLVMFPDEQMIHKKNYKGRFDLQFGRKVLANTLHMAKRADWKVCEMPLIDEKKLAQRVSTEFAAFDWTKKKDPTTTPK